MNSFLTRIVDLFAASIVLLGGIGLLIFLVLWGQTHLRTDPQFARATHQPDPPVLPQTRSKTVSFMPGQALNIPNHSYRKIEVRSEYPVRVLTGPCHSDYTVEFFCESAPADLFIVDTRRMPIFLTPRANTVTVTATTF